MASTDSSPSSPVNKPLDTEEPADSNSELILDDAQLLSILASVANKQYQVKPPPVAILNWEDWNQDVPEFVNNNNKRKRNDDNLIDSDEEEEEEEFNFLDQFDFVDVSFDPLPLTESNKKQKLNHPETTADNNIADDLLALMKESDLLLAELVCGWGVDTKQ